VRAFLDRVAAGVNRVLDRLPPRLRTLARQFTQVGIIGLAGLVVDVGVFNLLLHFAPAVGSIGSKVISTGLAILVNWIGNRYWTFRRERRRELVREAVEFLVVSVGGSLIALACLAISHYGLGLTDRVSDNISANVVGLVLGTLFRFVFYRLWVFHPERGTPVAESPEAAAVGGIRPLAAPLSSDDGTPVPPAAPR